MSSPDTRFALVVVALLALLGGVSVGCHEMGRDELHSWGVALTSGSLGEHLENHAYDTHPKLWFVCLYALSRITREPAAMPALSLAFSLAAAFVLLSFAPFPRWVRVLYVLGYLHLYEYGTLSRGYTQGEFFAVWLCAALPFVRERPWLVAVPLFFLPQTSLYGVFLAGGFAAALLGRAGTNRAILITALAPGFVLAAVSLWPKPDSDDLGYRWFFAADPARLMDSLCVFAQAYLPVPVPGMHFWCSNLLDAHFPAQLALSVLLALLSVRLLAGSPRALALFAIPAAAIVSFAYVKTAGQIRHHGHLFLAFVYAAWVAEDDRPVAARPAVLGALLAVHAVAGLGAVAADIAWPFSQSAAAVAWLRHNGLAGKELVGEPDAIAAPVGVLLERPVYFVDTDRTSLFVVYRKRDGRFNAARLAGKLRNPDGVVWITNRPLDRARPESGTANLAGVPVSYHLLYDTGDAIRWDERYHLYRVLPAPKEHR